MIYYNSSSVAHFIHYFPNSGICAYVTFKYLKKINIHINNK